MSLLFEMLLFSDFSVLNI